ncbi:MAG: hypothetical protein JW940_01260 [Polyangiaceae bacterium]|nr:hypothetical protein [Polyangiaceae bacterium]
MSDREPKRESLEETRPPSEPTPRGDVETENPPVDEVTHDGEEAAPPAPPKPQRRRGARDAEYDARGRQRPRFLQGFPEDPGLVELVRAFEAGNYARVRREAPALAQRTTDARVRTAARELRRRIDPDPALRYILVAALALLAVLVWWAYGHSVH